MIVHTAEKNVKCFELCLKQKKYISISLCNAEKIYILFHYVITACLFLGRLYYRKWGVDLQQNQLEEFFTVLRLILFCCSAIIMQNCLRKDIIFMLIWIRSDIYG